MSKNVRLIVCAVLCLIFVFGVTMAGYQSSVAGQDRGRVAAFVFDANGGDVSALVIDCATQSRQATYDVIVTNVVDSVISDVSMLYSIEFVLDNPLPSEISVTIDGVSPEVSSDGCTYVFSHANWQFSAAVAAEHNHELIFTVVDDNISSDMLIPNIAISVIAEQID